MPRVWITPDTSFWTVVREEDDEGKAVEMNASLYRQIKAAEKQFFKFQEILYKFYIEAAKHPDSVRRVR